MPTIPTYYSKGNLPTEGMPRIPEGAGGQVGAALARSGEQLAGIGFKRFEEQQELNFISELADKHTEAMERLTTLRRDTLNSPKFYEDPDGAAAEFSNQAKALRDEYLAGMGNRMSAVFKRQFGGEALSHINHVADAAFKQKQALGEGKFINARIRLGRLADATQDVTAKMKYIGLAEAYMTQAEKMGIMKPADREKEMERFKMDRAEVYYRDMAINRPDQALSELGGRGTGAPANPSVQPIEAGNIDLENRPVVKNQDGSISTVRSISIESDGKTYLIPTVSDTGKIMSNEEAVQQFKETGKHLGAFGSEEEAGTYAKELHQAQEQRYAPREGLSSMLKGTRAIELIKTAQTAIDIRTKHEDAEIARQEARAERERKTEMDQAEMDAWGLLRQDKLTPQHLEYLRYYRKIGASGYNALSRSLTNQENINYPEIELNTWDEILSGRGDKSEILRMSGRTIKSKTAEEMLKYMKNMDNDGDVSKTHEYKEAMDFVDHVLTVSGPGAAMMQEGEGERKVRAKRELDSRIRNGESPQRASEDIVERYRPKAPSTGSYPHPMFITGDVNDLGALRDAEKATVDQFKAGYIDFATFEREAANLRVLVDIVAKQQQYVPPKTDSSNKVRMRKQ